jgi:arylsulfatase
MNLKASIRKWAIRSVAVSSLLLAVGVTQAVAQNQKPNIVMLMTDDTGWNDFGAYSGGGAANGHPTCKT